MELFLHEYNIALLGDTLTLPQKEKFKLCEIVRAFNETFGRVCQN